MKPPTPGGLTYVEETDELYFEWRVGDKTIVAFAKVGNVLVGDRENVEASGGSKRLLVELLPPEEPVARDPDRCSHCDALGCTWGCLT